MYSKHLSVQYILQTAQYFHIPVSWLSSWNRKANFQTIWLSGWAKKLVRHLLSEIVYLYFLIVYLLVL